ncbi:MAG TPA: efflux RND transporter permease subunit [Pyrinomonadaceae bacterium]|jgi:CzcA family heavy metal efflux pump|nr:acriflavin resistance protein [Acidobacteriota bacterium]
MNLARTISRQSRSVIVFVLLLCAAGLFAAWNLPTAIFPNTDFPRIIITIENGEIPADQMLVSVTQPVEEAMNGIPGIERIKSTTARGSAEVNLFFNWKTDILQTQQFVQARLSQLTLPATAKVTHVDRLTFAVFPVSGYSLTSEKRDTTGLREIATYTIRPRLARLAGVANVQVEGGKVREFQIEINSEKLSARNVTVQQVTDAVTNANIVASPGLIEENHQLELALVSGQATTPDQLNSIVVANVNGANVLISDIAVVREGTEPNYTIVTADGREAVLFNVLRQPDANTVSVTDEVKNELAAIEKTLPKDVRIAPFYDQSILVRESQSSVRDAIIIGLILSVIILLAFLRNIGTTLVAVIVIPVTILATFLAMYLVGLSFDLMTLGGVAAAIGLVIDDAIVVVENIYTHLLHGESRHDAVQKAISEITIPIIGSTVTPVVVFLPLTLLTGVTGVFFRSLALTMAVALLTSLVLALTFTPVLAEKFVKVKKKDTAEELGKFLSLIIRPYEWLLSRALKNRWLVLAICGLILLASFFIYKQLGSEFLPAFDEGAFVLDYVAPPGTSLQETDRILRHVEEMLADAPEVESYSRRTGLQLGLSITEPNTGDFLVKLKQSRSRSTEEVMDDLRGQIETSEPALEIEFVGILSDLIGDLTSSPEPIEIKVFSDDKAALHAKAEEIEASIKKIDGVVDTNPGIVESGAAVTFKVNSQQAAQFGVSASDIAGAVETAMSGSAVSAILEKGKLITVRVVFPKDASKSLEVLKGLQIRSSSGAQFRLDQVATVEYDKGQTEISRDGLRQTLSVTARITGSDLGSTIDKIKAQLAGDVKLPAGMTIEYGGLYAEQQASFRELAVALILAIVLVFLVLLIEFRSFAHPIAIVTGAVLALSGVLLALLVTKTTLNVVSLMGMIMVVGIVAKNGILMLDAIEENLTKTKNLTEALIISGRRRFRPVLMTSLAAILGMLPLALAIGSGAELLQPLAIAVIGGLAFALLLSLVVTPVVYALISGRSNKSQY